MEHLHRCMRGRRRPPAQLRKSPSGTEDDTAASGSDGPDGKGALLNGLRRRGVPNRRTMQASAAPQDSSNRTDDEQGEPERDVDAGVNVARLGPLRSLVALLLDQTLKRPLIVRASSPHAHVYICLS